MKVKEAYLYAQARVGAAHFAGDRPETLKWAEHVAFSERMIDRGLGDLSLAEAKKKLAEQLRQKVERLEAP